MTPSGPALLAVAETPRDRALAAELVGLPKIKMILRNLITNALKFTTAGTVEVCCGSHDGALVLRVTDTGPGVDPADRAQIFDMFKQGDAGRRAGGSGLGLGLYLVKRLAEIVGGAVTLQVTQMD